MELALVLIIVAISVAYAIYMLRRASRGGGCNCGCHDQCKNCNSYQSCDCCPMKQNNREDDGGEGKEENI